jgi:hypothetical protein
MSYPIIGWNSGSEINCLKIEKQGGVSATIPVHSDLPTPGRVNICLCWHCVAARKQYHATAWGKYAPRFSHIEPSCFFGSFAHCGIKIKAEPKLNSFLSRYCKQQIFRIGRMSSDGTPSATPRSGGDAIIVVFFFIAMSRLTWKQ